MFKNIVFFENTNKIHLWETIDGKTSHIIDDYHNIVYTPDIRGNVKDIYGTSHKSMEIDSKKIKDLKEKGMVFAESDLDPRVKYLQKRYANQKVDAHKSDFNIAYMDIETETDGTFPKAGDAKFPINLITVKLSKNEKVYTFGTQMYTGEHRELFNYYDYCENEKLMLINFVSWFRKAKVDIITGWNVENFDIVYIINRIINVFGKEDGTKLASKLSPINKIVKKKRQTSFGQDTEIWDIKGITILDYLAFFKDPKFCPKIQESYTLQYIGKKFAGEGKVEYEGTIQDLYKNDWNLFVEYNIQDVNLVEKIDKKMEFIELGITIAAESLIPIDRIFSAISIIEGYMLKYLHINNMVMPDRKSNKRDWWVDGGYYRCDGEIQNSSDGMSPPIPFYVKGGISRANPGFYKDVMSFDVESMYPHIIMGYNISPETKVTLPKSENGLIKSDVNGVYYKKDKVGILPTIVRVVFDERKKFKMKMFEHEKGSEKYNKYNRLQGTRKILINAMYGVLILEYFHFYDVDNARAITRGARQLIRYLSSSAINYMKSQEFADICGQTFNKVPKMMKKNPLTLIDTDSSYLTFEEVKDYYAPEMSVMDFCLKMQEIMEKYFLDKLEERYESRGLKNNINFKREGIITKQMVVAKKRYIVELLQKEKTIYHEPTLDFTGVEIKRSSTPVFCKNELINIVQDIFDNTDKEKSISYIRDVKRRFMEQSIDGISEFGSVQEYSKWAKPVNFYLENGLSFAKGTPSRNKAAIAYNYLITKYKIPMVPIGDGSKIKFVRLNNQNKFGLDWMAWVGNWPKKFDEWFEVDKEEQFDKTILEPMKRFHEVLGWCDEKTGIQLKKSKLSGMFK